MHIVAGIDQLTEGTVEIAGQNITRMGCRSTCHEAAAVPSGGLS